MSTHQDRIATGRVGRPGSTPGDRDAGPTRGPGGAVARACAGGPERTPGTAPCPRGGRWPRAAALRSADDPRAARGCGPEDRSCRKISLTAGCRPHRGGRCEAPEARDVEMVEEPTAIVAAALDGWPCPCRRGSPRRSAAAHATTAEASGVSRPADARRVARWRTPAWPGGAGPNTGASPPGWSTSARPARCCWPPSRPPRIAWSGSAWRGWTRLAPGSPPASSAFARGRPRPASGPPPLPRALPPEPVVSAAVHGMPVLGGGC